MAVRRRSAVSPAEGDRVDAGRGGGTVCKTASLPSGRGGADESAGWVTSSIVAANAGPEATTVIVWPAQHSGCSYRGPPRS